MTPRERFFRSFEKGIYSFVLKLSVAVHSFLKEMSIRELFSRPKDRRVEPHNHKMEEPFVHRNRKTVHLIFRG